MSKEWSLTEIDADSIELMPESVAREHTCLPICREGDLLHVACPDHNNVMLQDKLRFMLNCNVRMWRRPRSEIIQAINTCYGQVEGESADSCLMELTDASDDFTLHQPATNSKQLRPTRDSEDIVVQFNDESFPDTTQTKNQVILCRAAVLRRYS